MIIKEYEIGGVKVTIYGNPHIGVLWEEDRKFKEKELKGCVELILSKSIKIEDETGKEENK